MATEVVMPKLGLTMETGTIGSWLISEGEKVDRGAPLLEVVTDKVTMEVEAQVSGVLRKILVQAGEEVPVTTSIGIIGEDGEDITSFESQLVANMAPTNGSDDVAQKSVQAGPPISTEISSENVVTTDSGESSSATEITGRQQVIAEGRPHKASPKARKMAADLGIDLDLITGSGAGGRIVSADLKGRMGGNMSATQKMTTSSLASEAYSRSVDSSEVVELTRTQEITAERLTASYQQIPHIHIGMEISCVWLQQFRQGYAIEGKKISFNDMIVKSVGRVLTEQPRFNSVLNGSSLTQLPEVNIGIAVDTPQGLLVPVLRNVPKHALEEINKESRRVVDAARHGKLSPDDMMGGTFTISNLGMLGVSNFTAIINPPQVAILAVGAIEDRVVAIENNGMAVRPTMSVSLAADHRALDGAVCARFLARLKEILETPGLLA